MTDETREGPAELWHLKYMEARLHLAAETGGVITVEKAQSTLGWVLAGLGEIKVCGRASWECVEGERPVGPEYPAYDGTAPRKAIEGFLGAAEEYARGADHAGEARALRLALRAVLVAMNDRDAEIAALRRAIKVGAARGTDLWILGAAALTPVDSKEPAAKAIADSLAGLGGD